MYAVAQHLFLPDISATAGAHLDSELLGLAKI